MKLYITILITVLFVSCFGMSCFAACPPADLTGDCFVGFEDLDALTAKWLDDCNVSSNWCDGADITQSGSVNLFDFAVLAKYWLDDANYTLSVNSFGVSGVSISSSTGHDGITNYTQTVTLGTTVTLTAPAAVDDVEFTSWTGDVSSSNQTISFSMDEDKTVTANYLGLPMVYISGGTFQMGDSFSEGDSDELPVHSVTLDSFYMDKYEITNGQYCQYLNSALGQGLITVTNGEVCKAGTADHYCQISTSSPYSQIAYSNGVFTVRIKDERDMFNDPMILVTWWGAVAYCNWQSQQEGREPCYNLSTWMCDFNEHGYRLPTEAEWEYAARGGLSDKRFPWGDTISHSQANYYSSDDYFYDISPTRGYHPSWGDGVQPHTSPVGWFAGNGYGLYGMAGNVQEWCNDWYSDAYYSSSPPNNPTGPVSGTSCVIRGGAFGGPGYPSPTCRVAYRTWSNRYFMYADTGFRVVLSD